jgi:hypothetical protein
MGGNVNTCVCAVVVEDSFMKYTLKLEKDFSLAWLEAS